MTTTATASSPVGTYPITASGYTSSNYAIVYVPGTLTVNKAVATVVAERRAKFYGTANPALTAVVTGAVTGGDTVNYSLATTAVTLSGVGSYPITVTLGSNPNYDVTKTDAHVNGEQGGGHSGGRRQSQVLRHGEPAADGGGDRPGRRRRHGQLQPGDDGGDLVGVGDYPITVTLGSNPNYDVTDRRALTVDQGRGHSGGRAQAKFYGTANPALTAVVTGQVAGGDAVNYSLATTAVTLSGVGSYPITVTLGTNPNYDVTTTDAR